MREFLNSTSTSVIIVSESADANGVVTVRRTGLLQLLKDAMGDETVAGAQTIRKNIVASGSVTADPDNIGSGTLIVSSTEEYVEPGTVILVCTDETIGQEKFTVTQRVSESNVIVQARNTLRVTQGYLSSDIGFAATLNRSPVETGDGSNQLSNYTVSGLSASNSDGGKLYYNLTNITTTRTVDVYKDSARTLKVASGSRVGDGTITLSSVNASGLTGSVDVVYTTDDIDIMLDMKVFKLDDEFRFNITNDQTGILQTIIGRTWKIVLPSAISGSETIKDGSASEGMSVLLKDHAA
jgi:hypothetical protein